MSLSASHAVWLFGCLTVGWSCAKSSNLPDPPPELRYATGADGVPMAHIDVTNLAVWCEVQGLPAPPAIDTVEPTVAEALYAALRAAARDRSATALGRIGMIAESLDAHHSAIAYFRLAAASDPQDFRWPYYLGCTHQVLGENLEAIALLEVASDLQPTYATAHARLGQLYLDEGRSDAAKARFTRYTEMRPQDWFGHVGLGRLALLDGNLDEARGYLERAAEIRSADFQVQFQLGRLYTAFGDRAQAKQHFDAAAILPQEPWFLLRDPLMQKLEESAGSAASLHREFERLSEAGDWPTLAKLAEEIVQRRPNDATMLLNLAGIYRKLGRFEEAYELIDQGVAQRPGDARFPCARAETLLADGDFEPSLAAAERALESEPDMVRALAVRGRARLMLGRYGEAEADLRQVVEQLPQDPSSHFALGEALRLQGKLDEAASTYRRVLDLDPRYEPARQMLEQLSHP